MASIGGSALRVVFAGTPQPAVPALQRLLAGPHEVVAVITRPDAPAGRGRSVTASPVGQLAAEAGVEVLKPTKVRDPEFLDRLRELAPDCCPIVAYGALIPAEALAIPRLGWINLHFSLLPAWRGAAPVQHAVLAGDDLTGASTFQLEQGLDTGPVFGVVTEPIAATDTSGDLLERLAHSGAELLAATLNGLADGSLRAEPQPSDGVSLAPKLTPEDARIDWHYPAVAVDRRIRACTPAPGAWTTFRGQRVKLLPLAQSPDSPSLEVAQLPPGQLGLTKKAAWVGTATTPVQLGRVQPQGKQAMLATDWVRGVRPEPHEVLGD